MKKTKIIIVGMGGQGVQTIAKILASAIIRSGLEASYIPQFGVEQRGTPSMALIILSPRKIGYPLFDVADWVLILHPQAVAASDCHIDQKTKIIFDSSLMSANKVDKESTEIFGLPAIRLATEKFSFRAANLIMLGKISQLLNLPFELIWRQTSGLLGEKLKGDVIRKESRGALLAGYESSLEEKNFSKPSYQTQIGTIIFNGVGKQGFLLAERCKSCGICLVKCPVGAIKLGRHTGSFAAPLPEIDIDRCTVCDNCFLYCPDGAIKVEKI